MAARLDFGIQYQADVGDPVGVEGVTGAPGLLRVVADSGTVLMAVEHFDGGVAIQYPRGAKGFPNAVLERVTHPGGAAGELGFALDSVRLRAGVCHAGRQMLERAAQTFVADDLRHAQKLRRDAITAQSGDVGIAALSIEDR